MTAATIADYDPAWPLRAAGYLADIRAALAGLPGADGFDYAHIGSTSVPGLAAKPIVDLQVRLPSLPGLDELAALLAPTGFVPAPGARPDSPGVHRDIPRPGDPTEPGLYVKRLFHSPPKPAILHIRRRDSPFAAYCLGFRDWLRAHPEQAQRYADVKRMLAGTHSGEQDYDDYTRDKTAFLDEVQPAVRPWYPAG